MYRLQYSLIIPVSKCYKICSQKLFLIYMHHRNHCDLIITHLHNNKYRLLRAMQKRHILQAAMKTPSETPLPPPRGRTRTHTHKHTHSHASTHTYARIPKHSDIYTRFHTHTHVYTHMYARICKHTDTHTHAHTHTHTHVKCPGFP